MADLLCPNHGPYDASFGRCPYCEKEAGQARPVSPPPLGNDAPTDLGYGTPYRPMSQQPAWSSEAATDLGPGQWGQQQPPKVQETSLGQASRISDYTELEVRPTGILGILWVSQGPRRGSIHKIQNVTIVGRRDAALILDDPKVSNPHAKFTIENGEFIVWDFGSSNGTYVNGEKIRGAATLKENDSIRIGDHHFILKVLPE